MKRVGSVRKGTSRRRNRRLRQGLSCLRTNRCGRRPAITQGDVAILQFLAAAELIESDLCRTR
jgi:hypothetical protein